MTSAFIVPTYDKVTIPIPKEPWARLMSPRLIRKKRRALINFKRARATKNQRRANYWARVNTKIDVASIKELIRGTP